MGPTVAVVGLSITVIVTSAVDAAHGELLIVQRNTLTPEPSPVTVLVGDEALVIVPLPLIKLQLPVPLVGLLPDRLVLVEQIV